MKPSCDTNLDRSPGGATQPGFDLVLGGVDLDVQPSRLLPAGRGYYQGLYKTE